MSVFFDTNVLVYAHDASGGAKRDRAQSLIRGLWDSGNGCLSLQLRLLYSEDLNHGRQYDGVRAKNPFSG